MDEAIHAVTTAVKFNVSVTTWTTSEPDPDDEWDRGSTDGSVSICGAQLAERDAYDCLTVEGALEAGDKVWLVWAQYQTGDSFGSDGGQYELLEAFTSQEAAQARAAHYETVTDYSVPWNGYFERLDGIYVTELTVAPTASTQQP